jgi:hypothetical protein
LIDFLGLWFLGIVKVLNSKRVYSTRFENQ